MGQNVPSWCALYIPKSNAQKKAPEGAKVRHRYHGRLV